MQKIIILLMALPLIAEAKIIAKQKRASKIMITDAFVASVNGSGASSSLTLQQLKAMTPNSALLNTNFTGYTSSTGSSSYNSSFMPSIGLTGNRKKNPLMRVGLILNNGIGNSLGYSKSDTYRIDTLTSSQTGAQTFVDSVNNKYYNFQYSYKTIGLDAALIYRTNPKARWSLYGGVGVNFTVGVNATLNNRSQEYKSINNINNNNFYSNAFYQAIATENISTESKSNTASVYLPIGIDFRIGRRREFFKRIHLFAEARPNYNVLKTGTNKTKDINASFAFGARVNWR